MIPTVSCEHDLSVVSGEKATYFKRFDLSCAAALSSLVKLNGPSDQNPN